MVFRSGAKRATITGSASTEVNVIGVLSLGYCQAVLKRTKPSSEKTTSSNGTVYRLANSRIPCTMRLGLFEMRSEMNGAWVHVFP